MGLRIRVGESMSSSTTPRYDQEQNQPENEVDSEAEPVSPAGRMFIQPQTSCTIICIIGLENPADIPSIKQGLLEGLASSKRFCSVVKLDKHGREQWIKTQLNIDNHVFVPSLSNSSSVEDYAASLATAPPLDLSKPLWEIHILNVESGNSAASMIFRIHHSLGDGTSLMSLVTASLRKVSNPQELPSTLDSSPKPKTKKVQLQKSILSSLWNQLCRLIVVFWYTLTEVGRFVAVALFLRDSRTPIKASAGVERMSKQIVSMEVSLEDMKLVKQATNATINDVLLGIVSAAITRYLRLKLPKQSFENLRVHATGLVNIRRTPGIQELAEMLKHSSKVRWGNQMGYLIIPIPLKEHRDPLEYVESAKEISKRKKSSLEAPLTHAGGSLLMKLAGVKAASDFIYRTCEQTTMSISNVAGPLEQVMLNGNPITSFIPTVVGQPQALCIHLQSYAGKAKLVATVAKEIIPDPHLLLQYCCNALQEMKQAAANI